MPKQIRLAFYGLALRPYLSEGFAFGIFIIENPIFPIGHNAFGGGEEIRTLAGA